MRIKLEIIAASPDDAVRAAGGGADRLELCSALALGGLTPSLGTVQMVKASVDIPVMTMVRPREGGMHYSRGEFDTMLRDAELLLEAGADGLVFGFLKEDGQLDRRRCESLMDRARQAGRPVQTCFHRAFDVVADPDDCLEQLVDLGVQRILTSGRAPTAMEGLDEIQRLVELSRGRIEILPGGGIDRQSAISVVKKTGVREVHLYVTETLQDRSVTGNPAIYFGAHVPESELDVQRVDEGEVARIRGDLDRG